MEKAEENRGNSRIVEDENVELNLGLSLNGGSEGSVASNVTEFETQQSPIPGKIAKEKLSNFLLNMPCVFTRGDGPNEKKTEGLLYSCKKREEVKIVCLCHGNFLTAAEFVKHAGGDDIENPLEHIFVS